ncbi:hypothetical protein [Rhizobium phage RHph_X2_26]|nr:hypothetical protein [Rhizobium phage RHph_X2_26]
MKKEPLAAPRDWCASDLWTWQEPPLWKRVLWLGANAGWRGAKRWQVASFVLCVLLPFFVAAWIAALILVAKDLAAAPVVLLPLGWSTWLAWSLVRKEWRWL